MLNLLALPLTYWKLGGQVGGKMSTRPTHFLRPRTKLRESIENVPHP